MDRLHEIEVFIAVADAGSFAKAGARLRLSPPAVTRAISALEDRLGARVFNRTTRSLTITDVGQRFLEGARRVLADLDTVDLLVLDERRYFRVISPYYLFRKKLSRPALVVFVGMHQDGMQRFAADLMSGHLDGFRHEIVTLRGGEGVGVAYEEILP